MKFNLAESALKEINQQVLDFKSACRKPDNEAYLSIFNDVLTAAKQAEEAYLYRDLNLIDEAWKMAENIEAEEAKFSAEVYLGLFDWSHYFKQIREYIEENPGD